MTPAVRRQWSQIARGVTVRLVVVFAVVLGGGSTVWSAGAGASTSLAPHGATLSNGLALSVTGPSEATAGRTIEVGYQITNDGPQEAISSVKGVAVSLGNMFAPGASTSWSSTSPGWTCSGPAIASPTCVLQQTTLAVGATAPPLIVTYNLAKGALVTPHSKTQQIPLTWSVSIAEGQAGGVATSFQNEGMSVVARVPGDLQDELSAASSSLVSPGKSVAFHMQHLTTQGFGLGMTDTVTLPSGTSMQPVRENGWVCPAGSKQVTCTFSGTVAPGASSSYDIVVNTASAATNGVKLIKVTSSGENGLLTAATAQPLFLISIGGPRLQIQRFLSATSPGPITNGAQVPMSIGAPSPMTFGIENVGDLGIPADATLTLVAAVNPTVQNFLKSLPSQASDFSMLLPPAVRGGPVCAINKSVGTVTCVLKITKEIGTGQSLPRLSFSALVSKLPSAEQLLAIPLAVREIIQQGNLFTLTASLSGVPNSVAPVTLDVKSLLQLPALPNVQPNLVAPPLPLGGGPQVVSLTLTNFGAATSGGAVATFVAPAGITPSAVTGSVCGVLGQVIRCQLPDLAAGTADAPSTSAPIEFRLANLSVTTDQHLTVSLSLGGGPPLPGPPVPISVNPDPVVTLAAPSAVVLSVLPTPGQMQVVYNPSPNAPAGQEYLATACLDAAMTTGCVQQNVTSTNLLLGLAAGTKYFVTVTAEAHLNYSQAVSVQVSATTASATSALTGPQGHSVSRPSTPASVAPTSASAHPMSSAQPPATGATFSQVCSDVQSALNAHTTSLNENLGGAIAVSLSGLSLSGACSGSPVISFSSGSVNLYGSYTATIGGGSVSASGFTINAASVTTPSSWPGGSQTLSSTSPVTMPFQSSGTGSGSSSSVSFQGSFSTAGLFGLPLPSGWTAQTSFTFSYANSAASIALSSTAGPSGSGLSITGSATTSGTFSVSVSGALGLDGVTISNVNASWSSGSPFAFAGTIALGGSTLNVAASYSNSTSWSFSANGSTVLFGATVQASGTIADAAGVVTGSFTMSLNSLAVTSGMTVNALTMTWAPGQGITGTGSLSLGDTTLNLSGSYSDAKNWTFAANGTVTLFGVTAAATGSVVDSAGTTSGSYTMNLGDFDIASGLSVTGLTMNWATGQGLTGSGAIVVSGMNINIAVSYTDSSNWTLTANTTGSGTLTILPGVSLTGSQFSGTVSKSSGVLAWAMSESLASVTLLTDLATLQNPVFTVSNTCPANVPASSCPNGNRTYLSATGTLQLAFGNGLGTQNIAYYGVYGVQTGGFDLNASLSSITIVSGLLAIDSPSVDLSYNMGKSVSTGTVGGIGTGVINGYTLSITGGVSLRMPGFSQSVPVTMLFTRSNGVNNFTVSADLSSLGTLGGTGAKLSDLAYSSVAKSMTLAGLSVSVPSNSLVFGGTFVPPAWLSTYLGSSLGSVSLYAVYTSPTSYSVSGTFSTNFPIPTGTSSFQVSITSFSVSLSMSAAGYTQTVSAAGTLAISGSAGNATVNVVVGLSYQDATSTLTGSLTASGTPGNYLWSNAFGLPGANIVSFAISFGVEFASSPIPLPSLGLAATIVLSGSLMNTLGITSGATILAVVNMSVTNPCMDIQIGAPDGQAAISIAGGLFTATNADVVLAPDGCTVGTYVVPAGFSLDFQGKFLGVAIGEQARLTINGSGFNLNSVTSIGSFNIAGAVNFSGATVTIDIKPGSQAVGFAGSVAILGVNVMMSGSVTAGPSTQAMSLSASVGNFNLYGFGLQNVAFAAAFSQTNGTVSFSLGASAQMVVLGNVVSLPSINFAYSNGAVTSLLSDVLTSLNLNGVMTVNGSLHLTALSSSSAFTLSSSGTISLFGFTLNITPCANGAPGMTISTTGFNLCAATLTMPMFSATLSGAYYWSQPPSTTLIPNASGQYVPASANDFFLSVSNVSIGICGFGAQGSVSLGDVGGTFYATMKAALSLSNTSSDAPISLSGSFTSQGNFTETGQGNLMLAGIGFQMAVTASVNGSNVGITGTTTLGLGGTSYTLTGSFQSVAGGVKVNLALSSNLTMAGYNLGQGTLALAVQPGSESISIADNMSLGGIFTGSLNGYIGAVNAQPVFNFNIAVGVNIPGVPVSGMLGLTNCTDSSCTSTTNSLTATLAGSFKDVSGVSYNFGAVRVNSDWSFNVTSSGSTNSCTGWTSLGFSRMQGCVSGSYNVTLSSSSPYLSFTAGFGAGISGQVWVISFSCSGHWYDPSSWRCSDTSHWGSTHNLASVGASIDSQGNVRAGFRGATFQFKV